MSNSYPAPHEVFTPGAPPLNEHNVYAKREAVESALRKFIQRHQVPVVWGEYGVGKTSLVQRHFLSAAELGRLVYVPSVSGMSLPDIFQVILEHVGYSVDVTTTSTKNGGIEGGFDVKVIKAKASEGSSVSVVNSLVVTSPTDVRMNSLLRESGLTVVLDEMHKASDELRTALVDWIKATRVNPGDFNLVLVGTSTDAGRLVSLDQGIDRYIKEMSVELMNDDEARFIVTEGFSRLGLTASEPLTEKLIRSAAGAPTIVQALCLDAAESALGRSDSRVEEVDLKFAVREYLSENTGRLYDHYIRAIETTGKRRYRKQVLRAVAVTSNDYATMDDVRKGVSDYLNEDIPASALSGPLRALKTDDYGNILKDVERTVSGQRIHNLSGFTDPMMKSFVRFMNNLDDTGLMPSAPAHIVDGQETDEVGG